MTILSINHWHTKNGAKVLFVQRSKTQFVDVNVIFSAGSAYDGEKYGLSQLTNGLLDQGIKKLDANQISTTLEEVGATVYSSSDKDVAIAGLRSLTKDHYFRQSLDLFTQVLCSPTFPKKAFMRVQNLVVNAIKKQEQLPDIIARKAFYEIAYQNHPYAQPVLGKIDSVLALELKDIKTFYKQYYVAKNALITIVGDVDLKKAEKIAHQLSEHLETGLPPEKIAVASRIDKSVQKTIPFPSEQTHILMGQVGVNLQDSHYFPILLGNAILGGSSFSSRLFNEVRAKHGLAYHVSSYIQTFIGKGPFVIAMQSQNKNTKKALSILNTSLNNFIMKGPSKRELETVKQKIINSFPLTFMGNDDVSHTLMTIGFQNLPLDYMDQYCDNIQAVTLKQIKDAFQHHFDANKMVTVLVGRSRI